MKKVFLITIAAFILFLIVPKDSHAISYKGIFSSVYIGNGIYTLNCTDDIEFCGVTYFEEGEMIFVDSNGEHWILLEQVASDDDGDGEIVPENGETITVGQAVRAETN